jgi:PhzF family phenazine biosynthesis protein
MPQSIYQVDAFAHQPFTGNPAGVCLLDAPRDDAWMQNVALEMNLAETAFLCPEDDGWRLRWFTPLVEVDLCGHATLASAHLLYETGVLPAHAEARFYTRSGLLTARKEGDLLWLDFPAEEAQAISPLSEMTDALGISPQWIGRNRMDYLVEAASEAEVRALNPDFRLLSRLPARGIIVTARSEDEPFDFVSRFFAPAAGINEDPVTGSAHCCLAPFWQERLNKRVMTGYQASPRGGIVQVEIRAGRVALGGQAITTLRGELLV